MAVEDVAMHPPSPSGLRDLLSKLLSQLLAVKSVPALAELSWLKAVALAHSTLLPGQPACGDFSTQV